MTTEPTGALPPDEDAPVPAVRLRPEALSAPASPGEPTGTLPPEDEHAPVAAVRLPPPSG